MASRPEGPSAGVVLTGGVAVAVVIGFVVALALGGGNQTTPGERVAVAASDAPSGVVVLAGRCRDQRVVAVTVRTGDDVRWRVESRKGSIARRYLVGSEPPLGFEVTVPFAGSLDGPATAEVVFERPGHDPEVDQRAFDRAGLVADGSPLGDAAPPCGDRRDLSSTVVLFALGAAVVVAGYLVMVGRWLGGRRR